MKKRLWERFFCCVCCAIVSCWMTACVGGAERKYYEGAQLYQQHCSNCHMEDGQGLEALYPPLAQSDWLETVGVSAACVVRNGLKGAIVVNGVEYGMAMPAQEKLSAVEITNILNYIHNAWGNERAFISLSEVEKTLEACAAQ